MTPEEKAAAKKAKKEKQQRTSPTSIRQPQRER
jgi:hypothetical protein